MADETTDAKASSGESTSPLDAFRTSVPLTGHLAQDVPAFLTRWGHAQTAEHSQRVANEAERIATLFGADAGAAGAAGWLHDSSAIFPTPERATIARQLGLEVLPAEDAFPMIVHQKLSVVVAQALFGIHDAGVLSAIGCHTTLRQDASVLDKVVFVADKIAWDQFGDPPYLAEIHSALAISLDAAAYCYLDHLWQQRHTLRVIHPWVVDAHKQLGDLLNLAPESW